MEHASSFLIGLVAVIKISQSLKKLDISKKTLHFPESFATRLKFSSDTQKRLLEGASFFIIPSSNTCFSIRKLLSGSIEYQSDHAIKI